MIKYISAILVTAILTVGVAVVYFVNSDISVNVESSVKVKIGVEPTPIINVQVKNGKVWGA